MSELDGSLGLALGAIIAAIRKSGISEDELRQWVESALKTYAAVNS